MYPAFEFWELLIQLSSVQDGVYIHALENPYVLDPIFQKFSKRCLSNGIGVCLIDDDHCRPKAEH